MLIKSQEHFKVEDSLIYNQYLRAIDARDKLNENYHRWMTFYYVALGSILYILIGLITSEKKHDFTLMKFWLCLLASFISIIWNLSCKGYYYWSNSWIQIVKQLESKIINENPEAKVYTDFIEPKRLSNLKYWIPTKPANISTPKLTLFVSLCSTVLWFVTATIEYFKMFDDFMSRFLFLIFGIIGVVLFYGVSLNTRVFESKK